MQRALAPKHQVSEIARFVRQCGGAPKHSEVLELVARLNGAHNWNALQNRGPQTSVEDLAASEPAKPGFREVDTQATQVVFIGTTMFDDDEPWFLMAALGGGNFERGRELEDAELELLQREGVAVEGLVCHPRADRYGLPDVAFTRGLLEWLHDEQGISSCVANRFELFSEDTGDDSPATCVLTMRLPTRFTLR